MRIFQDKVDEVNKIFKAHNVGLNAEIVSLESEEAQIYIEWGDWKHEHGYADYVMNCNGFCKVYEKVTEEDGSDCYSSIHHYKFNWNAMLKR